jgi:phosphotransacetylase
VLRAGFQFLGLAAGVHTASIGGLVEPVAGPLAGHLVLMTDTGAVLEPTVEQFVDIAANAVRTWRAVSSEPARIAFLSASTHGSAPGLRNLDTIRSAVRAVRSANPSLAVDGELQLDAAVVPAVALAKGVAEGVAGNANILIFPNIDSCNIGYKIAEHLGGAFTVPVTQGFARSYHDVSRGATSYDLVATCMFAVMIAATQKFAGSC